MYWHFISFFRKAVEERDRLATQNQQEAWWKKNTNGESAETRYYEKYQKQERERMQAQTFKANSSIFVTGSVSSKTRVILIFLKYLINLAP